jgi:hypothetical protein
MLKSINQFHWCSSISLKGFGEFKVEKKMKNNIIEEKEKIIKCNFIYMLGFKKYMF